MLISKRYLWHPVLILLLLLAASITHAQLQADFTADNQAGCAPLTVNFTNTTQNASASPTYQWDMGGGRTSSQKDAGTIYTTDGTYTVKLTVTDGGVTSVKNMTITVYKKPLVDFGFQPARGCAPLAASFSSQAVTYDGATVATYLWDYGDGKTDRGSALTAPSHTYTTDQTATVSFTVTDTHGCTNTAVKNNIITILAPVKAVFIPDKTIICNAAEQVSFTNQSTGPGTLTYQWAFGDGGASTIATPTHAFAKGTWQPELKVTSSEGCSDTYKLTPGINVANFNVDFTMPAQICTGTNVTFVSNANPIPDYISWSYSDGTSGNPRAFANAGPYTVTMQANYGTCQERATKSFTVLPSPPLRGMDIQNNGVCGAPATIVFKDTTSTAIKWQWVINGTPVGNTQSVTYNFNSNGIQSVNLTVTDAAGCTANLPYALYLYKPIVRIYYASSTSPDGLSGCEGYTVQFKTSTSERLVSYKWSFGDGGTSTDPEPFHTFNKAGGPYNITLDYTTENGCKGTEYLYNIMVYKKPGVSFTMKDANPICGNTPVHFDGKATNGAEFWSWYYEGNYNDVSYGTALGTHQYSKEGTYSVILVAANGTCRDTATQTNQVTVVPPFPKISDITNTCDGDRATVTFKETSRLATAWDWDFGDGGKQGFTLRPPSVMHKYPATGTYKVVLTATNGQCKVRDSVFAYVLKKQHPVLTIDRDSSCASDTLHITVTNEEGSPYGVTYEGDFDIRVEPYKNGSLASGRIYKPEVHDWMQSYEGELAWLPPGTDSVRVITTITNPLNCDDTTGFVTLAIKGPDAAFTITKNGVCFNTPNEFTDRSTSTDNVPIVARTWDYGDNILETVTATGVQHTYTDPGSYRIKYRATDADGCYDTATYATAVVTGPKADFTWSPAAVKPGNTVTYTNTSNLYNISQANFIWTFSYSGTNLPTNSINNKPIKTYNTLGVDTVRLIASNPASNCVDTMVKLVYIKNIHALFTFTSNYVNGNECPPMVASFTNQSQNYTRVSWNFGDDATAGNINTPTHSYTKPGIYQVTLYAYDNTGDVDSITLPVTVKGPSGTFVVDKAQVCGVPATLTFTATTQNVTSFAWDFGDGPIQNTNRNIMTHVYTTPGAYKPIVSLQDGAGCAATFELEVPFVIDTLNVSFSKTPATLCNKGGVQFTGIVKNIAADQLQLPPAYHWNFGTGNPNDTANTAAPSFYYTQPGKYIVRLTVTSAGGCTEEAVDSITVISSTQATITAPAEACQQEIVRFTATANGTVENWKWDFTDGGTSAGRPAASHAFEKGNHYRVQLIVTSNGCTDTAFHDLEIHALPDIGLLPRGEAIVCLGDSLQLQAYNGTTYSWQPAIAMSGSNSASPKVSPATDTRYMVQVTDGNGCINKDSVLVQVAAPFTINLDDTAMCKGASVPLVAMGAATYKWIAGDNLSDRNINGPVASPLTTGQYTVVGYDKAGCFTDTATITVTVYNLPVVNAIADTTLTAGSSVTLQTQGSSDVVNYKWAPSLYLDCANCQSPVSTPRAALSYVVTATTQQGCTARDTVAVMLSCLQSNVFIPNTFTPNKDGRNDRFYPRGKGIRLVKYLRIYNRLGELVFERASFAINEAGQGWDGTFQGNLVGNGIFTYITEMICDGGDIFRYKGSIMLIR